MSIKFTPLGGDLHCVSYSKPASAVNPNMSVFDLNKIIKKEPYNIKAYITLSQKLMDQDEMFEACQVRYEGAHYAFSSLPEEEYIEFDWEDCEENRDFLTLLYLSGCDSYYFGEWDTATTFLEMALELDPEDHLDVTSFLPWCYAAIKEWELLEELETDMTISPMESVLLKAWIAFQKGENQNLSTQIGKASPELLAELRATDHPLDDAFLKDIDSQRPAPTSLARELWMKTASIWNAFPEFIEKLRNE